MEIHQHTHTPRKKWTHYFWEFLMLFLAVFCGFLAEYQLEHKLERNREKEYIHSLVEDLESDTAQLQWLVNLFSNVIKKEDSLKTALMRPDIMTNAASAYPFVGYPLDGYAFHRSERTIQQLKNAGGLRLIHSVAVSNKINEYDEGYRKSDEINLVLIETYHHYTDIFNRVVNAEQVEFPYREPGGNPVGIPYRWITNDSREIKIFFNTVVNMQWVTTAYMGMLKGLRLQAIELIGFLKKEYHLERKQMN